MRRVALSAAAVPEVANRLPRGTCRPSALALGTSAFVDYDTAAPVFDAWMDAGCNVFDSAWIYGTSRGRPAETVLGRWIRERGVGRDVVVLGKAAHPPHCHPDTLAVQLYESLDRLGLEAVDMVAAHRDDISVPVGEWVDALAELAAKGTARSYGVSNWTLRRLEAMCEYADWRGHPHPAGLSNQLSLAEMVKPIYDGCQSVRDDDCRRRLTESGILLLPWASQGRGIFAVASERELVGSWLAPCWYSEANVGRLHRAQALAAHLGVSPMNVALAWVLHQPFPCLPVVGPQTPDEVADTVVALGVRLGRKELRWLEGPDPAASGT